MEAHAGNVSTGESETGGYQIEDPRHKKLGIWLLVIEMPFAEKTTGEGAMKAPLDALLMSRDRWHKHLWDPESTKPAIILDFFLPLFPSSDPCQHLSDWSELTMTEGQSWETPTCPSSWKQIIWSIVWATKRIPSLIVGCEQLSCCPSTWIHSFTIKEMLTEHLLCAKSWAGHWEGPREQ